MTMNFVLSKASVLVSYIGQKVLLTTQVDWAIRRYPVGAIGTLDSIQADGNGGLVALVVFDEDASQDWVEVPVDALVPAEFADGYLVSSKPIIHPTPSHRLERLKKTLLETNKQ